MHEEQFTLGEEITNAILHGIGFGLAVAALIVLVVAANVYGDIWYVVSFSIYGATLVFLYLSSTLHHSFPKGKAKDLFAIFDHAAIYLLIAGTYTPATLISLRGPWGWSLLAIVWTLAIAGIIFKVFFVKRFRILSTTIYIVMGWLLMIAIKPLLENMNLTSLIFLVTGGVIYTLGTIFYHLRKMKYHHAVWHLFVLAGSAGHFLMILFLLPKW